MKHLLTLLLALLFIYPTRSNAQTIFNEGVIIYHVTFKSTEPTKGKSFDGTYTFYVKGNMVRKELKLNNGYNDVVIMNGNANTLYTLQNIGDRKYAIQHDMEEHLAKEQQYEDYTVREGADKKDMNGYEGQQAYVTYKNGTRLFLYYTKKWHPSYKYLFERIPDADFLPLEFDINEDDNKISMHFVIEKIELKPVQNASFVVPTDRKMISYSEYKELNK